MQESTITIASVIGNASHTPVIPKKEESRNAKKMIATNPRMMEDTNAHLTDSTALRAAVPMMLIPAKKKPRKYRRNPFSA